MKTIKYKNIYGIGENADPWENISLEEFVLLVPELGHSIRMYQNIPSLDVLNDFFSLGEINCGMSGFWIWKIFTINIKEYEDLFEILYTDPKLNIKKKILYQELKEIEQLKVKLT